MLFVWGQFRANGPVIAPAAVAYDLVYVDSERGALTALELHTGTLLWSFAAGEAISASPVISGEVLYVASYDWTLTALDARHGTLHWQFTAEGTIHATPVVRHGQSMWLPWTASSMPWSKYPTEGGRPHARWVEEGRRNGLV